MAMTENGARKRELSRSDDEEDEAESFLLPNPLHMKIGGEGLASLDFHPRRDLLGLATTGGRVRLYDLQDREDAVLVRKARWHRTGRVVRFSPCEGRRVFSGSAEGGVKAHDVETGTRTFRRLRAHEDPVTAILALDEDRIVTGSESGELKIFDCRTASGCAFKLNLNEGLEPEEEEGARILTAGVNDLALGDDGKHLMVACDDGCLRVVSVRGTRKLVMQSETLGYPARTVTIAKRQEKVLVGTEEGVLNVFNWKEWGNLNDRISLLKASSRDKVIEAVVKVTEDVLCVATDDGKIRAINLLPNRVLGLVGEHKERSDSLCDQLSLATSSSRNFVASGCLDSSTVRFWPVQHLATAAEEEATNLKLGRKKKRKEELPMGRELARDSRKDFLQGLCPEEDSDSSGSSDETDRS